MVVIGGLRQHGLQLLRTSVAHKIRVTSALINWDLKVDFFLVKENKGLKKSAPLI